MLCSGFERMFVIIDNVNIMDENDESTEHIFFPHKLKAVYSSY